MTFCVFKIHLYTLGWSSGIPNFFVLACSELKMSRVHRVYAGFARGRWCVRVRRKQRVLLGDGWVVEHGHSFHAQQHGQTPRNHVVEDNGAGGGGAERRVMRPRAQHKLMGCTPAHSTPDVHGKPESSFSTSAKRSIETNGTQGAEQSKVH